MRRVYLVATIATAAIVLALGFLVWPTPWRYERVYGRLVRFNRVTDHADALCPDGWHTMQPGPFADIGDVQFSPKADICLVTRVLQ